MKSLVSRVCVFLSCSGLVILGACSKSGTDHTLDNDEAQSDKVEQIESSTDSDSGKSEQAQLMAGIFKDANSVEPLLVGELPSAFTVKKADGSSVTVNPNKLSAPVVLTFFRGGWCPYCNRHLAEMRTVEASLKEMGFEVWFMSIDKPELLYDSLKEPNIGYTLFSDSELEATKAFGIGFAVDDATHEKYLGYGIDLSKASGFEHHVLPAPSTFILGKGGRVHFQHTNPDYKVRLAPEDILVSAKNYVNSH